MEDFLKHSLECHNPRNDGTREIGNGASVDMATVMEMLSNMDRRMTKMDQSIHVIRVGCENCNGPRLTKDCHLDEKGIRRLESSTQVETDMMNTRGSRKRNGCLMMSTKNKNKRITSKRQVGFIKKKN